MTTHQKTDFLIQSLISSEKWQDAYDLVCEELHTSFVPQPFFNKWNNWKKELYTKLKVQNLNQQRLNFLKNLKKHDLATFTIKNNKIDFAFLETYLQKFQTLDHKEATEYFQYLLNSTWLALEEKFALLGFLIANSTHRYNFFNQILSLNKQVDLSCMQQFNEQAKELKKEVSRRCNKNITYEKLAEQLLNLINVYYFPSFVTKVLKQSEENVSTELVNYIQNSFDTEQNQKTPQWLRTILDYFLHQN